MHCNQCLGLWHHHHTQQSTHTDQYQCSSQHSIRTHKSLSLWHSCFHPQCLTQQDTTYIARFQHQICRMQYHMRCNQCLGLWHLRHTRLDTHTDQYQCSSQHSIRKHKSLSSWHSCLHPQCLIQQDMRCIAHFQHQICRMQCHRCCNQYQYSWHRHHTQQSTHNDQYQCSSQHSIRTHKSLSSWHLYSRPQCLTQLGTGCTVSFLSRSCRLADRKDCIRQLCSKHRRHNLANTRSGPSPHSFLNFLGKRTRLCQWLLGFRQQ